MKRGNSITNLNIEENWTIWSMIEPTLHKYCAYRWSGNGEDILSETKILFVETNRGNYHPRQALIFAKMKAHESARNSGYYRSLSTISLEEVIGSDEEPRISPEDAIKLIKKNELVDAMQCLQPFGQKVLQLKYWQDMSLVQISLKLKIGITRAYRLEKKSLKKLRKVLARYQE